MAEHHGRAGNGSQPFPALRGSSYSSGEHTHHSQHPPCSPAHSTSSLPFPQTSLSALQQTELQFGIQYPKSLEGGEKTDRQMVVEGSSSGFVCHH